MQTPTFSIIVPTFARAERLAECLAAIAAMDYPRTHYQTVVVDDGSPTSMEPVVAPFRQRMDVAFIRQPNAGPAAARNTGASVAKGEMLAFTDDDCQPGSGWLQAFATAFQEHGNALLGGRVINALPHNPYAVASQQIVDYLYEYFVSKHGNQPFFTSNNLSLTSEAFRQIGGFDVSFPLAAGEDRDLGDRWQHMGGPIRFVGDAVVAHAHDLDLARYWRQHRNYGCGACHLHRRQQSSGRATPSLEPLYFYGGLLAYPLRRRDTPRRRLGVALMALSQLAVLAGYGSELLRQMLPRSQMASRP